MPASVSVFARSYRSYLDLGYSPLARFENSWPLGWSDYCLEIAPLEAMRRWAKRPDAMIALACGYGALDLGKLVAFDCDTSDSAILAAARGALPQCRFARFGSKGFALLARYTGPGSGRFGHIYTGEGAEKRPLIEIKGVGHNITVPPSIHHKTSREYQWIDPESSKETKKSPAFAELPAVDDDDIARLRDAMGRWASKPRPAPEPRSGFDPNKIAKTRYEAWFRKSLDNARIALSQLTEGRPTALFRSVCALGAGVHHGFIPESEFEGAYLDACEKNGLSGRVGRHALLASIASGLRFAADDPLPDLGETATRKPKAAKAKRKAAPNGSGGTEGKQQTSGHDDATEAKPNGFDHDDDALSGNKSDDKQPTINISKDSLSQDASGAERLLFLAKVPIFHQGGFLVQPTRSSIVDNQGNKVRVPAVEKISITGVVDALSKYIKWRKWDGRKGDFVGTNPPKEIAQVIHDRRGRGANWRILAGVTNTPILRRNGTIAMKEGYDDESSWFLQDLPPMPPMPPHPNRDDAMEAFELLKPLLADFPFTDSDYPNRKPIDTASYSVALSAILSVPARPMMNIVPGHVATANEAGTGKTYLFNIASAIGLGTRCPTITQSDSAEENEKRLGAQMVQGAQIICIDNVNGELRGDLLAKMVTDDEVTARILGKLSSVAMTNRFVVFATGNNIRIIDDLNRRMLICEMDAMLEHPSERRFEFDPVAEILRNGNRGKYIAACLTIIRAYHLEGYGEGHDELPGMAGFEEWTKVVRGAICWLGLRDPRDSVEKLKKDDASRIEQRAFVEALAEIYQPAIGFPSKEITVAEMIEEVGMTRDDGHDDARKLIDEIFKVSKRCDRFGKPDAQKIGIWFGKFPKRRLGDLRLCEGATQPRRRYYLERLPKA